MAKKKEWNKPAEREDSNYIIDFMTIAPMKEIPKTERDSWTKATGKEEKGKESVITYKDLDVGMTIIAENGGQENEIQH